ncbi:hypothetical protein PVAG01_07732 [Phlyctema vagabunda]|uniref:Myb-like DNA-binding domain-containing protein n=1 Tax=Phlyctema vagabunda TaxID=108571 RepID=A0ABR4PD99_9HELO
MSRASNEEQFKFLISCIRYSNNGKVDFGQVAQECNIISKGAAAKRYERMMKIHGIHDNTTTRKPTTTQNRAPKTEAQDPVPSKKRKGDAYMETTAADDDEVFLSIKKDPVQVKEEYKVKEEPNTQEKAKNIFDFNASLLKYMDSSTDLDGVYNNFSNEPNYHFASTSAGSPATPYGFESASGTQHNSPFMGPPYTSASESYLNPLSSVPTSMSTGVTGGMGADEIPYPQQLQYSTDNVQGGDQRVPQQQQQSQVTSTAPRGSHHNSIVLD